jgi:hypothetical protein
VLDYLAVRDPPDVYLLGGELIAGRLPAEELTDVVAVHRHARDDLVLAVDGLEHGS